MRIESADTVLRNNIIARNTGAGVAVANGRRAFRLVNTTVWAHVGAGILVNADPPVVAAPAVFHASPTKIRLFVTLVPGELTVTITFFGNLPATDPVSLRSVDEGTRILGEVTLGGFAPADFLQPMLVDVNSIVVDPDTISYVTAVATFPLAGSSEFSPPVAVVNDTQACRVCLCSNTTVDCTNRVTAAGVLVKRRDTQLINTVSLSLRNFPTCPRTSLCPPNSFYWVAMCFSWCPRRTGLPFLPCRI